MRYSKVALLGFLMLNLAGSALAQQQGRNQVRSWIQNQRSALAEFTSFEVQASVHHSVEAGNGSREATATLKFSGDPLRPAERPEILRFVLNGDSLDTSGSRRVQQGLTSMMSPEIGPLLYGFLTPVLSISDMRPVGGPFPETVDGEKLEKYTFVSGDNQGRPNQLDNGRPPVGRPRPGDARRPPPPTRDGVRPNQGEGRPGEGRPGGRPMERTSLWFDGYSGRLVMSSAEFNMPGGRRLVVETSYKRIEGIDVPAWRTIKGSFTMQRRLRTVTAKLEHESLYSDYSFGKN